MKLAVQIVVALAVFAALRWCRAADDVLHGAPVHNADVSSATA